MFHHSDSRIEALTRRGRGLLEEAAAVTCRTQSGEEPLQGLLQLWVVEEGETIPNLEYEKHCNKLTKGSCLVTQSISVFQQ